MCPDDMDELITMIGDYIQYKKIKENVNMSEGNIRKICFNNQLNKLMRTNLNCMKQIHPTRPSAYEELKKNYEENYTIHKSEIPEIEKIEIQRANLQKEKNEEYLPIMEAMYKAIKYLHITTKKYTHNI